jgi:hypothetical protein
VNSSRRFGLWHTTAAVSSIPYDWDTGHIARELKVIRGDGIALVEGVSVLHPDLAPLYDLRIWVESDPETTLAASLERGVGSWAHEWQFMFLPSVELYLRTDPKSRADVVALGRGLYPTEPARVLFHPTEPIPTAIANGGCGARAGILRAQGTTAEGSGAADRLCKKS